MITLVPKVKEAETIKQYRPICLLNVDYKGFTKVLTERLTPIAKKAIGPGPNQTGFIQGRNILEGVILHEVVHELSSKKKGTILKLILKRHMVGSDGIFYRKFFREKASHRDGLAG